MVKFKKHKGISRIDQPEKNTYGWYVRVIYNGTRSSKFFSDKLHGGKVKAHEQALAFRDKTEKDMGKPRTDRTVVTRNPRNTTGIVGIARKIKYLKGVDGGPKEKHYFEVTWTPWPRHLCRVWISIDKLGEKKAFLRACAIRREKEKEMYGSVVKAKWTSNLGKIVS